MLDTWFLTVCWLRCSVRAMPGIVHPLGQQLQHLELTRGQLRAQPAAARPPPARAGGGQLTGDPGRDRGFAARRGPDALDDLVDRRVLDAGSRSAPASSASVTLCSSADTVSTSTRTSGAEADNRWVAAIPDMPGMLRSISATSGCSSPTSRIPSAASPDSPTTTIPRSSSSCTRPPRNNSWSSMITTRGRLSAMTDQPNGRDRRSVAERGWVGVVIDRLRAAASNG